MKPQEIYKSNEDITEKGLFKTTVLAGNGIFEIHKSWIGESLKKVEDYKCFGLPELQEKITVTSDELPKIPAEAIKYVIKWYRDTTLATGKEAQINFYNAKGKRTLKVNNVEKNLKDIKGIHFWSDELFSYTPEQRNSAALTSTTDEVYNALNTYIGMYVETHSHNSMQAFASGTDLANSKVNALQLVFGQLNTNNVQMHTWITVCGVTSEYVAEDIVSKFVELPEHRVADDKKYYYDIKDILNINFDEKLIAEWEDQVVKYTVPYVQSVFPTKHKSKTTHTTTPDWYGRYRQTSYYDYYDFSNNYYDEEPANIWDNYGEEDCNDTYTSLKELLPKKIFNNRMDNKYQSLLAFLDKNFTLEEGVDPEDLIHDIKAVLKKVRKW